MFVKSGYSRGMMGEFFNKLNDKDASTEQIIGISNFDFSKNCKCFFAQYPPSVVKITSGIILLCIKTLVAEDRQIRKMFFLFSMILVIELFNEGPEATIKTSLFPFSI